MNEASTLQRWSPVVSSAPDDFASFLDFGDLNFSGFQDASTGEDTAVTELCENMPMAIDPALETAHETLGLDGRSDMPSFGQQQRLSQAQMEDHQNHFPSEDSYYNQPPADPSNPGPQQWQAPNMVPPTPNSMDLHGNHMQQYSHELNQQRQRDLYEQYRSMRKDQMNFTPLVSPAVTPLETQLHYVDHPMENFSPLTSPALLAANNSMLPGGRGLQMPSNTSPVDCSFDYAGVTSVPTRSSGRKSRRKTSTASTRTPAPSVKPSPATKPQHKKSQSSSAFISANEVRSTLEQLKRHAEQSTTSTASEGRMLATETSVPNSLSPEELSDVLMPPPATPQSASTGRSPVLNGKQPESKRLSPVEQVEQPATPASLMRIKKQPTKTNSRKREASHLKEQSAPTEADADQVVNEIALPEPAASRPKKLVPQSGDTVRTSTQGQFTSRTDKSHGGAPVTSTPSTVNSPTSPALPSPTTPNGRKAPDSKSRPRDTRKRGSISGGKISPALRPKISPSIKPLLPEGGASVSAETSALLLASKSNYQNILEGTHFPGVSYPENLSTNLTSKRTSHKIAEQGRRNRINTALQEIAALLPPTPPVGPSGAPSTMPTPDGLRPEDSVTPTGASQQQQQQQQQGNSKASTVEAAIDYIKTLQKEVKDCKDKIAKYEQTPDLVAIDKSGDEVVETEGGGKA